MVVLNANENHSHPGSGPRTPNTYHMGSGPRTPNTYHMAAPGRHLNYNTCSMVGPGGLPPRLFITRVLWSAQRVFNYNTRSMVGAVGM